MVNDTNISCWWRCCRFRNKNVVVWKIVKSCCRFRKWCIISRRTKVKKTIEGENKMSKLIRFLFNKGNCTNIINLTNISEIADNAFSNDSTAKYVKIGENIKTIEKLAFENCSELEAVDIGECSKIFDEDGNCYLIKEDTTGGEKGTNSNKTAEELTIQFHAFSNCQKLHTVIFPDNKSIVIEDEAFKGCTSLRTVVIMSEKVSISPKAFCGCSKFLTFVTSEGSDVERFARENDFRSKNA